MRNIFRTTLQSCPTTILGELSCPYTLALTYPPTSWPLHAHSLPWSRSHSHRWRAKTVCRYRLSLLSESLGAFRLAVPRAYGGLELDPMTQVRVVEELSRLDGSVGWCAWCHRQAVLPVRSSHLK